MPDRLRDHPGDLLALAGEVSAAMQIDPAFVEKDFWATELLRGVSLGSDGSAKVILKGGTSLSKAFGIIERFSEDIDVLLVCEGLGTGKRDRVLKEICERAGRHLNVAPQLKESTTGVKRNVQYAYPRQQPSGILSESLLLELGTRGGAHPHSVMTSPAVYLRLRPNGMGAGRHLYDVHCLLNNERVRAELASMARSDGVARLAGDIEEHSRQGGWPCTPRPVDGFAASPAFDQEHVCQPLLREAYERSRDLVWGPFPAYEQCLRTVVDAGLLL